MMAMREDPRDEERTVSVRTVVLAALLGVVVLLSIGAVAGAVAAWIESPANWGAPVLAIAGAVMVGAFATLGLLRLKPWDAGGPMAERTRKARNMMWASGGLGLVIGLALSLSVTKPGEPTAVLYGPLPPALVIAILAVWFLVVPLISWQWHRNVDEHEAAAYRFGGLAGLYLYAFVTPGWWLAWRGGLMPEPDATAIFAAVILVWLVGWLWRRHR